jgi:cob(I)alamin adenosyltransferase
MSAMNEGVIVLEGLLDAVTKGWLSARNVADTFAHDDSLLHIIVTGRKPVPEIVEIADLVSNMRAVKQRDANSPAIAGIDY